jgi:hypothetical protein
MLVTQMTAMYVAMCSTSQKSIQAGSYDIRNPMSGPSRVSVEPSLPRWKASRSIEPRPSKPCRSRTSPSIVNEGGQAIVESVSHKGGLKMKIDANPIDTVQRLKNAPGCHAKAKHTGEGRKCAAVQGWSVCRFDGTGGRYKRPVRRTHSGNMAGGRERWSTRVSWPVF